MSWSVAAGASAIGTSACVPAWGTDFRKDVEGIKIPTLVMHGDDDRIVPFAASGKRTAEYVKGSRLTVIKGGPHAINWTHAEEVNKELLSFLSQK